MNRELLVISMNYPDLKARDAGTKTFAYYFFGLVEDEENKIKLISLVNENQDLGSIDNVEYYPVKNEKNAIRRGLGYLRSIRSKLDPGYKYGNVLSLEKYRIYEKHLKNIYDSGYEPDVVIFEWTYMLLFIDTVKKYFPKAKYIASEQDVTFQAMEREYEADKNRTSLIRYKTMKQNELSCLDKCELIFVYSSKDKRLLRENGIDKTVVLSPFYDKRDNLFSNNKKNILFYGAMYRKENHTAAKWFIDEVMPLLNDYDVRFVVAGNKPPKELIEFCDERILVTGFVEDVDRLFADAMCFVAPLKYGAGIKIKILEAMSAGLPVLTNEVGIEGIEDANYFHCEDAKEYADSIIALINDGEGFRKQSEKTRENVHRNFDYVKSREDYKKSIYSLIS